MSSSSLQLKIYPLAINKVILIKNYPSYINITNKCQRLNYIPREGLYSVSIKTVVSKNMSDESENILKYYCLDCIV